MNLNHRFEIPADLETAWAVLLDIPRIAPCLPGAELTEVVGERTYKGLARVKVGPIGLQFAGEAEIVEVDDSAHWARVHAKGADGKGRGTADANVRFALSPEGEGTTVVQVDTDLNLTGAVAQYGRASGLIDAVANQIIADFVKNLEVELGRSNQSGAAMAPKSKQDEAPADLAATQDAPSDTTKEPAAPVSGLRLLFRAIVAMVGGWFRKRDDAATTGRKE